MPPLDELYFTWLYSQVGSVKLRNLTKTFWKLFRFLHEKEFTWLIEKDENRAQDGKDLRYNFLRETQTPLTKRDEGWMDEPCSILEMLVALAWKLEFDGGRTQEYWFWDMLSNLGLSECNDANPPDEIILNQVLNRFMNRDYASDGTGGLFPLQYPDKDQRKVELYYQAEKYLLERL